MKKQIAIAIAAAALALSAPAAQKFTGTITDEMCAKADHNGMKMGTDEKCVTECIKGMGHKYVLYDGKETYALSDQAAAAKFAAKKVTVTGTLDGKSIKVDKIEGREVVSTGQVLGPAHRHAGANRSSTAPPAPGRWPTRWCAAIAAQ